jgi:hypothetical protein
MLIANQRRRVIPIIPAPVLKRHKVDEPSDTRFRAAARLMQSLWRERQGYACGRRDDDAHNSRKLGSRLTVKTAQTGANFITPEVSELVRWELAYREIAATIDTKRLSGNLLSSQALTFNLFGPLKLSPKLATAVFRRLFPDFVQKVEDIWFEHSPGRRHSGFTGDNTAFDLIALCHTLRGNTGFIAIEVKYSEAASTQPGRSPRYDDLARQSGLFHDPDAAALRSPGVQQFWREHLLAHTMVHAGLYDEGLFIVAAPSQNRECQIVIEKYRQQLTAAGTPKVAFDTVTIETIIDAMAAEGAGKEAQLLRTRYFDFSSVDRALFQIIRGGKDRLEPARKAA